MSFDIKSHDFNRINKWTLKETQNGPRLENDINLQRFSKWRGPTPHYCSMLRSVDDSFVVVITMLLGELDYGQMVGLDSDSDGDNVMLVKIIVLLFIMMMSIVLINLIIGLAINDITTLR